MAEWYMPIVEAWRRELRLYHVMLDTRAKAHGNEKKIKVAEAAWREAYAEMIALCKQQPGRPHDVLRNALMLHFADITQSTRKRKKG